MAREISISFALTAALTGGFRGAFQSAASSARNVTAAIRDMERSPVGSIGATMIQQRNHIQGLAGSINEARATLVNLRNQAEASGGGTRMLARQIELAETRVNNLNGAMNRQLAAWRTTTAQAATVGGSIRQLSQDYERLSQRMERMRRVNAAVNANRAQAEALRNQRADLNSRLTGAMATAATVGAPIALSIGFEDQMAKVGAVSKASKDDLAALSAQARELGRNTSFSASQAAEGMQYLAMAGLKTNQVMAAMPGMLDLAAASGTDLGQTANIASNILSAFELKAEQMGHVGDVLVAAFTSSNTTLESLGETMKYVGPVAKDAGASIEDAVAMAAMLGNVGISGSQAGTTSKSIFARLAAPPTEAAKALNALNIKTKDAQGNLRAVPDLLEEITLKTASMGTADRTDVFSHIFGLEPMAGASALAKKAAETVDENGQQIVDSMGKPTTALLKFADNLRDASKDINGKGGMAARTASEMNATTGGSLRMLKSAWEEVALSVGDLFLPTIKTAAGALSSIANVISATTNRFPNLSKGVALVTGGVLALTAAGVGVGLVLNFVRTGLNGFRGGLLRMSAASLAATVSTTATTAATGGFSIAARMAGAGARFFAGGLRSILVSTGAGAVLVGLGFAINALIDNWDAVTSAMSIAWDWVTGTWSRLCVFFSELGNNLDEVFSGWGQSLVGWVQPLWNGITGIWNGLTGFFGSLFGSTANVIATTWSGISGIVTSPMETIKGAWNGISGFFLNLWQGVVSGVSSVGYGMIAIFSGAKDEVLAVWNGVTGFFMRLWDGISGSAVSAWNYISSLATRAFNSVTTIWNGAVGFFNSITGGISASFSWAHDSVAGIWQGITEFFGSIGQGISDSFTGSWNYISSLATWAFNSVATLWNGAVSFFNSITGGISASFTWAYNSVVGTWQGVSGFFGSIALGITDSFTGVWNDITGWATWAWESISGIWIGASEFFGGVVDSIFGVFTGFFDWLKGKFEWVFSTIDAVSSVVSSITGAVSGAWNAAFGSDDKGKSENAAQAANGKKATVASEQIIVERNLPPERRQSAAANAQNAINAKQAGVNPSLPSQPKYQPVSAEDYHAALEQKKGGAKSKGGGGSRKSSGGGGGRSRAGSLASSGEKPGSSSGPVTIVTLDSGNAIKTQHFPAYGSAAPNANRAYQQAQSDSSFMKTAVSTLQSSGIGGLISQGVQSGLGMAKSIFGTGKEESPMAFKTVFSKEPKLTVFSESTQAATAATGVRNLASNSTLPRTATILAQKEARKTKEKQSQTQQADITIDLTQNFDLITQDAAAARKVLEAIKPDMEALIRRALEKIRSDNRRTAYGQ